MKCCNVTIARYKYENFWNYAPPPKKSDEFVIAISAILSPSGTRKIFEKKISSFHAL